MPAIFSATYQISVGETGGVIWEVLLSVKNGGQHKYYFFVHKMFTNLWKLYQADFKEVSVNEDDANISYSMLLKLDVLASSTIKRKKPWPKIAWLGKVNIWLSAIQYYMIFFFLDIFVLLVTATYWWIRHF